MFLTCPQEETHFNHMKISLQILSDSHNQRCPRIFRLGVRARDDGQPRPCRIPILDTRRPHEMAARHPSGISVDSLNTEIPHGFSGRKILNIRPSLVRNRRQCQWKPVYFVVGAPSFPRRPPQCQRPSWRSNPPNINFVQRLSTIFNYPDWKSIN